MLPGHLAVDGTNTKPSKPSTPARSGEASYFALLVPLILLGVALFVSDRYFTYIDDECYIIDMAARPAFHTVRLYLQGAGPLGHPPLFDLILHVWLRVTHGWVPLLRLPSEVPYILGLWVLAQLAHKLGNARAALWLVWLGVLWPYGFHYGRLGGWYSFAFLVLALVTKSYVDWLSDPSRGRALWFTVASLALAYTNYFGWALLACFALDFSLPTPGILRKCGGRHQPPRMN